MLDWLAKRVLTYDRIVDDVVGHTLLRQVRMAGGWPAALICWALVIESANDVLRERAQFRRRNS